MLEEENGHVGTLTRPRDDNCGLEVPAVSMYVTEEAILASVAPLSRRHAIGFMRPRAPAATSTETEEKEAERGALGAGWMDGWMERFRSPRPLVPRIRAERLWRTLGVLVDASFGPCSDCEPPAGALLKVASARRKKKQESSQGPGPATFCVETGYTRNSTVVATYSTVPSVSPPSLQTDTCYGRTRELVRPLTGIHAEGRLNKSCNSCDETVGGWPCVRACADKDCSSTGAGTAVAVGSACMRSVALLQPARTERGRADQFLPPALAPAVMCRGGLEAERDASSRHCCPPSPSNTLMQTNSVSPVAADLLPGSVCLPACLSRVSRVHPASLRHPPSGAPPVQAVETSIHSSQVRRRWVDSAPEDRGEGETGARVTQV